MVLASTLMLTLAIGTDCRVAQDGRWLVTCFDPWRGLELSSAGGVSTSHGALVLGASFDWRVARDSRSKAESTWLALHRLGTTRFELGGPSPSLTVQAYEGVFRRHVEEGTLVLPTAPPVRLPFPFDVGLTGAALRYQREGQTGEQWALETVRLAFTLDPLHSASGRFHLGVGPVALHRLRSDGSSVINDVMPLTALMVFFDFESDDGLWLLRGEAHAGLSVTPAPAARVDSVFRARGWVEASRVLFSVNDQPLALTVRTSGAVQDSGATARDEWSATAGLTLRLGSGR